MTNASIQFNKTVKPSEIVLFPVSDISLKNVQSFLSPKQVKTSVVYSTTSNKQNIKKHDVYIFSSPSNVNSFFNHNQIASEAKVIAIGESTLAALKAKKAKNVFLSWDYHSLALWDTI